MKRILTLALANAVGGLHFFLVAYIASSYLGTFLSDSLNGLVFSAAAALMILGFLAAPFIFARHSVRRVALVLSLLDALTLLILSTTPSPLVGILVLTLQMALAPMIAYTLDLFLENATTDEGQTGRMRGLFLTAGNVSLVASPILIGLILRGGDDYARVFLAAAAAMLVFIGIIATRKRFVADETITHASTLLATLECLIHDTETRSLLIVSTILQAFYIWAPVYIPLYLHVELGFAWETLGPLFALMLLPFLLIELPMGYLADRFRGARLIMTSGVLITALSFSAFSLVTSATPLAAIAIVLVLTRVGAALIEIITETSFFRQVSGQDAGSVSFFRMTRPLGMLMGPLFGSFFLLFVPLQYVFVPLGLLCLFALPHALRIKDRA